MARCKSCNAEIHWAITEAGNRIPLDAEPVLGGNIIINELGQAEVVVSHPEHWGSVSHFATCPNAAEHRKAR